MRGNFNRALSEQPVIKRPFTGTEKGYIRRANLFYVDRWQESLEKENEWLLDALGKIEWDNAWQVVIDAVLRTRNSTLGALFESMDRL